MATPPKYNFYPVTGRSDTGIVAPRLPIEILQTKDEQFSLFVLSYLNIQDRQKSLAGLARPPVPIPPGTGVLPSTFFHIGAIHGKPYEAWPGDHKEYQTDFCYEDGKDTMPVPSRFGGYCNHGSVLFPTWHRAYILLIEQAIGEQATALAKDFDKLEGSNSTKWQDAANVLRFPYWDWAAPNVGTDGLPPILYEENITIKVPNNETFKVENPMALFTFSSIPPDFDNQTISEGVTCYFKEWKTTLRHAQGKSGSDKGNIDELQTNLKESARDLRSKVAALFSIGSGKDPNRIWDMFSNHSPATIPQVRRQYIGSIEGAHDSVHDIIGGLGHMGFPDYAGFDPIFFLHHCNVDRLYALWEYCYRNENDGDGYWMGDGYRQSPQGEGPIVPWIQSQGTFADVYNAQISQTTALAPFRHENGEYWTSKETRYLDETAFKKFYTYYETAGIRVDASATADERIAARKLIQDLYTNKPAPKKLPGGLFKTALEPGKLTKDVRIVEGHRQFAIVVELLEHAYNGPYTFKLSRKSTAEGEESEFIGAVSVFARPDNSPCAGCQGRRANASTIRGVIFIDESLVEDLINDTTISTGNVDEVADALKGILHAELQDPAGIKLGVVLRKDLASIAGAETDEIVTAPISIQLFSTALARKRGNDKAPVDWVDWAAHGDVFEDHEWRTPQV